MKDLSAFDPFQDNTELSSADPFQSPQSSAGAVDPVTGVSAPSGRGAPADFSHLGDFEAGIAGGIRDMKSMWNGFLAATGKATGSEDLMQYGMRNMQANQEAGQLYRVNRPTQVEEITDLSSFLDYAQFTLGSLAPFALESALSGLAGAVVGTSAPGAGTVVGGIGGVLAKKKVKDAIRNYVRGELQDEAEAVLAKQSLAKIGATMGAAIGGYPLHVGDAYNETLEAGDGDPGAAFAAAVPMAALDAVMPGKVVGKAMDPATGSAVKRVAAGVVDGAATEGLTEMGQEEVLLQMRSGLDLDFDLTGEEANSRRLNAGVAGAMGGSAAGGASSAMQRSEPDAPVQASREEALQLADPFVESEPVEEAPAQVDQPLGLKGILQSRGQWNDAPVPAPAVSEPQSLSGLNAVMANKDAARRGAKDRRIQGEVERSAIPYRPEPVEKAGSDFYQYDNYVDVPAESENRTDELAGRFEDGMREINNDIGRQARESRLPEGMRDPRLLREQFRIELAGMAKDLVKGGDVGYIRDKNDRIVGRTPSINPEWFKSMSGDPELSMSTDGVKEAVDKALAGERLGVRQARVVSAMLDDFTGRREEYARVLQSQRDQARQAAAESKARIDAMPDAPPAFDYDPAEVAGEVYTEADYLEQAAYVDRAIAEMAADALEAGVSEDEVFSVIDNHSTVNAMYELQYLARTKRAEYERQGQTTGTETGRQVDEPRSVRSEGTAQSLEGQETDQTPEADLLTSYTEEDIAARENAKQEAQKAEQEKQAKAEAKVKAEAEASDFRLTGSDLPADVSAAGGQRSVFDVDQAASESALSPTNNLPEPSLAQKEAGNYKKGHTTIQGMDIAIENPRDSIRSGVSEDGKRWESKMAHHYGYIKRTEGADGDHVDVFIGQNLESDKVFVVDQVNPDGTFDEHKVMIGFDSEAEAKKGYLDNYEDGWDGIGGISELTIDQFKGWLKDGDTTKPYKEAEKAPAPTQVSLHGVSVAIPHISKDVEDTYNRTTHIGKGRDFNAELKETATSLINELSEKKHTLVTDEQKSQAAELVERYLNNQAEFIRWESAQSARNPSWAVTGRANRNLKKYNAANEKHMSAYSEKVEALEKQRKRIFERLYDLRPQEVKSNQEFEKNLKEFVRNVAAIATERAEGRSTLEKENRKWASPKALRALESLLEQDRERAIAEVVKMNASKGLEPVGGLVAVLGPRSKAGKLVTSLLEGREKQVPPTLDRVLKSEFPKDENLAGLEAYARRLLIEAAGTGRLKTEMRRAVESKNKNQLIEMIREVERTDLRMKGLAYDDSGTTNGRMFSQNAVMKFREEIEKENSTEGNRYLALAPIYLDKVRAINEMDRKLFELDYLNFRIKYDNHLPSEWRQRPWLAEILETIAELKADLDAHKEKHLEQRRKLFKESLSKGAVYNEGDFKSWHQSVLSSYKDMVAKKYLLPSMESDFTEFAERALRSSKADRQVTDWNNATFLEYLDGARSVSLGEVEYEEFQRIVDGVYNNKKQVLSEISALSKSKILDSMGMYFRMRYKNDKKDSVVESAYDSLLSSFNISGSFSYSFGESYQQKLYEKIKSISEADYNRHQEIAAEERAEREEQRKQREEGIKDPKSLDDFHNFVHQKMKSGLSLVEARKELSLEQRIEYDRLMAEKTRGQRGEVAKEARTDVKVASQAIDSEIIETKHTKKGHDLFVVRMAERVSKEDYNRLNSSAKKLGGYYSSYRGGGAVPGFQFTTMENAQAFSQLLKGETEAAQEIAKENYDAFKDDKTQSAAQRLRAMSEAMLSRSEEEIGRDRKTNTARRANMAAGIIARAEADRALAVTMGNIADAIDSGEAKFLDRVRQKVQVEQLRSFLREAKRKELAERYDSYYDRDIHKDEPATVETVEYAEYPVYRAHRSTLANIGRKLSEMSGYMKVGKDLLKVADDITGEYIKFATDNLHKVSVFRKENGEVAAFKTKKAAQESVAKSGVGSKAYILTVKKGEHLVIMSPELAMERGIWEGQPDKLITLKPELGEAIVQSGLDEAWPLAYASERRKRLKGMGIETGAEFRSALREFIRLVEGERAPDPIKEKERSMVGRRNDGLDFFPTPEATTAEMLDAAEIESGMTVLEPSAGWGHIAEAVRDAGHDPDVIEYSSDRRELLGMKGFNVVGNDFMEFQGSYDRILMNPPFSKRRDAEHVQHAYTLLKPGGRIVAIMGEGVFFGQDKKATEFREWLDSVGGTSSKLEENVFMDSSLPVNTGVNARMVVIDKSTAGKFSKGVTDGDAMTVEQVESAIASRVLQFKNNNVTVKVVDDADGLPDSAAYLMEERGDEIAPRAYFDPEDSEVYLVASALGSVDEAIAVLEHEAVGHLAMEGLLGADFRPFVEKVMWLHKSGDRTVRHAAKRIQEDYGSDWAKLDDIEKGAEIIAKMAEMRAEQSEFSKRAGDLWNSIVDWFTSFFERLGFSSRFSVRDVEIALAKADALLRDGKVKKNNGSVGKFSKAVPAAQRDLVSDADKGMPIDRAFRKAFELGGMVDEHGRFDPPQKVKALAKAVKGEVGKFYKESMPWAHSWVEAAKRGLVDRYGLDKDYLKADDRRTGDERRLLLEAHNFLENLKIQGVDNHEEAKVLHAVLTGKTVDRDDLKTLAAPIRESIDAMGREAVELGLISQEAYERNAGAYLHRSYLKHEDQETGLSRWASEVGKKRRRRIIGNELKGRGNTIKLYAGELGDFAEADSLQVYRDKQGKKHFAEPGYIINPEWENLGVFEVRRNAGGVPMALWRDWTEAERQSMGEILDARYAIAKTYRLMAHDLAVGRFYQTIAQNPVWSKDELEPGDTEVTTLSRFGAVMDDGDWVLVPDTKIPKSQAKKWGALAGRYVRAEIWRDLNEVEAMNRPGFWQKLMTQWKLNKTARNPVVHMNNVLSNLIFMDMADVRMRDLYRALESMRNQDDDYQDALSHGAFGSGFVDHELRRDRLDEILKEIKKQATNDKGFWEAALPTRVNFLGKVLDGLWSGTDVEVAGKVRRIGVKPADQAMLDAYSMEDELFRLATYLRRLSLGDDPETAAHTARDQFLNYDIRAPWVNLARQTVLPFISYTYRAVPVIAKSLAERPWKIAKYAVIAEGVNALGYALAPGDEDEERRALGEDQQGSTWLGTPRMLRMPFRDNYGDPVFLDIRRWIPAGDVFDTNIGQAAVPIPAPLQWSGPLMLAAELMLNKQAFTGNEIINEKTDDGFDKMRKVADWGWKSWMPSAIWVPNSWYWEKVQRSIQGGKDSAGRTYNLPLALSSSFGLKLQPHNVEQARYFQEVAFNQVERALNYELNAAQRLRERDMLSGSEYLKEVSIIRGKLKELAAERRRVLVGEE